MASLFAALLFLYVASVGPVIAAYDMREPTLDGIRRLNHFYFPLIYISEANEGVANFFAKYIIQCRRLLLKTRIAEEQTNP